MPACPTESTLLAYAEGTVAPGMRATVEGHLSQCEECRVLVSTLVRASRDVPQGTAHADTELASPVTALSVLPGPGERILGKYRILGLLGQGGMGVVCSAEHEQLKDRVAIKFLRPEAIAAPGAAARFLREARACVRIKSPHVARVSDTGTTDAGLPYMVMEFLEGEDLARRVQRAGALPVALAVTLLLQTTEALAEAHALGIVHRDLKPANLFVTQRLDGSPCIKVLDFGISKTLGFGSTGGQLTSENTLMGSPSYMSPEQLRSTRDVDARTDIWSLGVVLHELLSGHLPFGAQSTAELCVKIMTTAPPPLGAVRPDVPQGLAAIVLRCLEKDPAHRFPSVGELALALGAFGSAEDQLIATRVARVTAAHGGSAHPSRPPAPSNAPRASAAPAPASTKGRGLLLPVASAVVGAAVVAGLVLHFAPSSASRDRTQGLVAPPASTPLASLSPQSAAPSAPPISLLASAGPLQSPPIASSSPAASSPATVTRPAQGTARRPAPAPAPAPAPNPAPHDPSGMSDRK